MFFFFISCKTESKKKVEKEFNRFKNTSHKIDTFVKQNNEEFKEISQKKKKKISLSYSLKEENVQTLQDSAIYLRHYYKQFTKTKDSLSENLFFKMLPDNFKNFNQLYGFSEEKGGMPLYGEPHTIEYDDIRKSVLDSTYYLKLINIGIDGKWDADNISMLQDVIHNNFVRKPVLFSQLLKNKNKLEIASFWIFFFDGPHPENKQELFNKVLNNLKAIDEAMIPIVKRAYAQVKEDWAEH